MLNHPCRKAAGTPFSSAGKVHRESTVALLRDHTALELSVAGQPHEINSRARALAPGPANRSPSRLPAVLEVHHAFQLPSALDPGCSFSVSLHHAAAHKVLPMASPSVRKIDLVGQVHLRFRLVVQISAFSHHPVGSENEMFDYCPSPTCLEQQRSLPPCGTLPLPSQVHSSPAGQMGYPTGSEPARHHSTISGETFHQSTGSPKAPAAHCLEDAEWEQSVRARLWQSFKNLDVDGDGTLTRAEFLPEAAMLLGHTLADAMFSSVDKSGDDRIQASGLCTAAKPASALLLHWLNLCICKDLYHTWQYFYPAPPCPWHHAAPPIVSCIGLGCQVVHEQDPVQLVRAARSMFAAADRNQDQLLSFQEFSNFLQRSEEFRMLLNIDDMSLLQQAGTLGARDLIPVVDAKIVLFGTELWPLVTRIWTGIKKSLDHVKRLGPQDLPPDALRGHTCMQLSGNDVTHLLDSGIEFTDHAPELCGVLFVCWIPMQLSLPGLPTRKCKFSAAAACVGNTPVQSSPRYAPCRDVVNISVHMYTKRVGNLKRDLAVDQMVLSLLLGALRVPEQMGSTGKSGSFFVKTCKGWFIVKSLAPRDYKKLREVLPDYVRHMLANPQSLLTRFCGIHSLSMPGSILGHETCHMVVMLNAFSPEVSMDVVYDLKGSSAGRTVPLEKRKPGLALKDLDLPSGFSLPASERQILLQQIRADVAYLEMTNVNDYSLLLAIAHSSSQSPRTHGWGAYALCPGTRAYLPGTACFIQGCLAICVFVTFFVLYPLSFKIDSPALHTRGLTAIIDLFTDYGKRKTAEYAFKWIKGENNFSCVPPAEYAQRFMDFMVQLNVILIL
eukprot:gene1158-415_t